MSDREIGNVANHEGACATGTQAPAPGLAVRDLRSAIGLMRERGLRVSAARRLVLEALLAADGPMSAEQIAEGIGGRVPSSDIGSVYRNLQALRGHRPRSTRASRARSGPARAGRDRRARVPHVRALCRLPRRGARELDAVRELIRAPLRLPRELHPLPDRRPVCQLRCGCAMTAHTRQPTEHE